MGMRDAKQAFCLQYIIAVEWNLGKQAPQAKDCP
jgi:hypothetical protein